MRCLIFCREGENHWVRRYFNQLSPYCLKFFNRPILDYYLEFCRSLAIKEIRIVMEQPVPEMESCYENPNQPGLHISFCPSHPGDSLQTVLNKNYSFCKGSDLAIMEGLFVIERETGHAYRRFLEQGDHSRCVSCSSGRILFLNRENLATFDPESYPEDKDPGFRIRNLDTILSYYSLSMEWLSSPEKKNHLSLKEIDNKAKQIPPRIPRHSLLVQPILMDRKVRIHNYCLIGPEVILGNRVIIDSHTSLERSIVYDETYIGRELEIHEKILFRNKLISPLNGEWMELEPKFIKPITGYLIPSRQFIFFFHWILSLILILAGLIPYLVLRLAMALSGVPGGYPIDYYLDKEKTTALFPKLWDRPGDSFWSRIYYHLSLDKYPLLLKVLSGTLYLSGNLIIPVNPVNSVLLDEMPIYHPALFGISELEGNSHDPVMRELNAFYYAGHYSLLQDIKILVGAWLRRLVENNPMETPG